MKTRRQIMGLVLTAIMVIAVTVTFGCAAAPGAGGEKTLKIGMNITMVWPLGLDMKNCVDWHQKVINDGGGLDMGGTKYKLELIWDDNKMDEALSKTATEKEIFQDGVKFIQSDMWNHSCFQLAEDNKVIFFTNPADLTALDPKWNYLYHAATNLTDFPMVIAYAALRNPDKKTYVGIFPDRADGRGYGELHGKIATASGLKVLENVYYNPAATDLSAIGTRIKQLNPDMISAHGGGPPGDSMGYKAAYAAGWRGLVLGPATIPAQTVVDIAGAAPTEGMISIAWPNEFDPVTIPIAKAYKDYYKQKFGKWDDPEIVEANPWFVLTTALQKAGAPDVQKVKAVLDNQMEYTGVNGNGRMIPRPDVGNPRSINTVVFDLPFKTVKNGKPQILEPMTKQLAFQLLKTMYGLDLK